MIPSFCRNPRPICWVACADVVAIPSTELRIAIGSPLTNALGIAGSVGAQAMAHFELPGAAAAGSRSQFVDGLAMPEGVVEGVDAVAATGTVFAATLTAGADH